MGEKMDKLYQAIGLEVPEVEYELLLLQFAGGFIVTLEEVQDGHFTQGVGGGVKMVRDRKVAEGAENDMLDAEVGGVICEDKGDSVFTFVGG
eukprot:g20630.t1